MKSVANCLPEQCKKKITNHSTRKAVVAKLKEAGQPRHKIIQVTGHARESSLDDYDEITESERRQLSHIASGYVAPKSTCAETSTSTECVQSLPSAALPVSAASGKENVPTNPFQISTGGLTDTMQPFNLPTASFSMATKHLQQAPCQVFNHCVFNTKNVSSASSNPKPKKRRIIYDSDSD